MEEGEDLKKMKLLVKELEINVRDDSYTLNRIGKKVQGRIRPLLIKPKDKQENLKGQMLKNAKKHK